MNVAMRDLTEIIWREGGFRFKHTGTNFQSCTYGYNCSQDLVHARSHQQIVELDKQRDGRTHAAIPMPEQAHYISMFTRSDPFSLNPSQMAPHMRIFSCLQLCKN